MKDDPVFKTRKRPSWQPPPLVFPVVWSTISLLRSFSSTLLYMQYGTIFSEPLLFFLLHLCIGDTWNTINNVENRLGTSVVGAAFVLFSVLNAILAYHKALPLAGYILAPSGLWLIIANCLIYSIWKVNSTPTNIPSLYPSVEEGPVSAWKWKL